MHGIELAHGVDVNRLYEGAYDGAQTFHPPPPDPDKGRHCGCIDETKPMSSTEHTCCEGCVDDFPYASEFECPCKACQTDCNCEACAPDPPLVDDLDAWMRRTPRPEESSEERIVDRAWGLVMGPRQSSYGHPAGDFEATGRMWGAILTNWLRSVDWSLEERMPDIEPRIVALMLGCVKLSRESHAPKQDNRDDGIGYLICADRIANGY